MQSLEATGFRIRRSFASSEHLYALRNECDRVFANLDGGGTRHICQHSELFTELASSIAISADLLPHQSMRMVRSIYFNKTPEKNWPVAWHQDLSIAVKEKKHVDGYEAWSSKGDGVQHVRPPIKLLSEMWTVRIHLDDAHFDNGALSLVPESHLDGMISTSEIKEYTAGSELCECAAGDALVMSPLILHSYSKSINPSNRRILHFEFAPEKSLDSELAWYESL